MESGDTKRGDGPTLGTGGFRISEGPVVAQGKGDRYGSLADLGQLPRNYGEPILFAIPRDPRTIFTYWNIDWSDAFARNTPVDRQVYLRVKRSDGSDEIEEAVEPMLGSHYALVAQPRGEYEVELGFYQPEGVWNTIASSQSVTMPPDSPSESAEVDVATVPFHLSFQRMIDLFRATNGDAVASVLSELQERATTPGSEKLSDEEQEILRAMNLSLPELELARRAFADQSNAELLRKRAEALLGFGATSPSGGPGGSSSWSSASA
jgi:hypothetical protein